MEHSKNFQKVKDYYDSGLWSEERVRNVVGKWITEEECEEIIGAGSEPAYTKSDINAMKAAEVRKLAEENGIENQSEYTSSELKEMLIEKLGL